jgi:surfeit locus 1 family protein
MTDAAPARRGVLIPTLAALMALAILLSLGTWQLERRAWKHELIDTINARLAGLPGPLPAPDTWARLDAGDLEFQRVAFRAAFQHDQEALVFTSGSALRPDVTGHGYWVFTPARLPGGGTVVVNRGFVPEGRQDPRTRPEGQVAGPIEIVGVLRPPEARGLFTPADNPAKNLWFVRDPLAMAAAKNWGAVAPFFVDQEAPLPPGGLPRDGPITPKLPDNHLQYAITWYGLAAVLVAVFAAWLRSRRRERLAASSGSATRRPIP